MDYDIWAEVLRVNLMAPMKMAEAFVEHVAASTQKKIVAISSTEGSIAARQGRHPRLPHQQGRAEHADAEPGARPRATRHRHRGLLPGLDPHADGRCQRAARGTAQHRRRTPRDRPDSRPERTGKFWLWSGETLPW
jgi:NAD(P)-dependent dehydrogenase (short-subunit alcohol dehydrogenase family)